MGDHRNSDALSLSLSPLDKNENLLKIIGYFWSNALNYFLFGHCLMTPTLRDVVMITGLDIASPSPSAYSCHIPKFSFRNVNHFSHKELKISKKNSFILT
jgi:hypothetical protein